MNSAGVLLFQLNVSINNPRKTFQLTFTVISYSNSQEQQLPNECAEVEWNGNTEVENLNLTIHSSDSRLPPRFQLDFKVSLTVLPVSVGQFG